MARMRQLSSVEKMTRVCWRDYDVFQWTYTCENAQLRPYPYRHAGVYMYSRFVWTRLNWKCIAVDGCCRQHCRRSHRCLGIESYVSTRAVRVYCVNAQQPHFHPAPMPNVTAGESLCRAATKISMKYHFASVCIGRTKLQHRLRGASEEFHSYPSHRYVVDIEKCSTIFRR